MWLSLIFVILLDLWDRCYTEKFLKRKLRSHRLRDTMLKIAEYWRFMLVAFVIDLVLILSFTAISFPYVSGLLCIGLAGVEIKSMFEHARERKSGATELKDILKMMIDCASEVDAKSALKKASDYLESQKPSRHEKR